MPKIMTGFDHFCRTVTKKEEENYRYIVARIAHRVSPARILYIYMPIVTSYRCNQSVIEIPKVERISIIFE